MTRIWLQQSRTVTSAERTGPPSLAARESEMLPPRLCPLLLLLAAVDTSGVLLLLPAAARGTASRVELAAAAVGLPEGSSSRLRFFLDLGTRSPRNNS